MNIQDLIGYQIINLTNDYLTIQKNNKEYTICFERDEGYCCGFNEIENTLYIDFDNPKNNPVITNIAYDKNDCGNESTLKITFFGLDKIIAEVNSLSSSGSGYCYGACVYAQCSELNINECLTDW